MKKALAAPVLALAISQPLVPPALAAVTVSPHNIIVPPGTQFKYTITWNLEGSWPDQAVVESKEGEFVSQTEEVLGSNPASLSVVLSGGKGKASETITVPPSVISEARADGCSGFQYRRTFADRKVSQTGTLTASIQGPDVPAFILHHLRLYFIDRGMELTESFAREDDRDLRVHAFLSFYGTGRLKGHWEVDGKKLGKVDHEIKAPGRLQLTAPETGGLPTSQPGLHRVRLVVTQPVPDMRLPAIEYMVLSKGRVLGHDLVLLEPEEGASLSGKIRFSWEKMEGAVSYLVTFTRRSDGAEAWAALVRGEDYQLPIEITYGPIPAKEPHRWQVTAYDQEGEPLAKSEERTFSLPELKVPERPQILPRSHSM